MLIEAIGKKLISSGKALKKLKDNPMVISQLTDYITEIEKLLRLPLNIIEVRLSGIARSHVLRRAHGLFVNDSINLACAERYGLINIVTRDTDFGRVPHLSPFGNQPIFKAKYY